MLTWDGLVVRVFIGRREFFEELGAEFGDVNIIAVSTDIDNKLEIRLSERATARGLRADKLGTALFFNGSGNRESVLVKTETSAKESIAEVLKFMACKDLDSVIYSEWGRK